MKLSSSARKRIVEKLREITASGAAPGVQLGLGYKDQSLGFFCEGYADSLSEIRVLPTTLFDLSSLTKIICTVSLWMNEFQRNSDLKLSDPLKKFFPSFSSALKETPLRDLFNHTSGLERTFEKTEELPTREQRISFFLKEIDESFEPGDGSCVYSDINFMVLGIALEKIYGKRLREIFDQRPDLRFGPIRMPNFFSRRLMRSPHAASLLSIDGEAQWINGVVQDPRAQWLNGDAGHAGLFGTADAVEQWGKVLYKAFYGKSLDLSDQVCRRFLSFTEEAGRFLNGFDQPEREGSSQAGKYFGPQSAGHLGFSGSSFWMDFGAGYRITLLSHRHAKGSDPQLLKKIRPEFHDWLISEVFSKL